MSLGRELETCKNKATVIFDSSGLVRIGPIQAENMDSYAGIQNYVRSIQNPYYFSTESANVKISFSDNQLALADILKKYLMAMLS